VIKRLENLIARLKLWLKKNKNCKHCCLCCEHYKECKDEFEWQKEDESLDIKEATKHSKNYSSMLGLTHR